MNFLKKSKRFGDMLFPLSWGLSICLLLGGSIVRAQEGPPYPRIGCFHFRKATPEWYAKRNLVISGQRSTEFAQAIKALNPDILLVHTEDWQGGGGISDIPSEWYVRDSKGEIVKIYGNSVRLVDHTDYCPHSSMYGNKRYNEYLPEFFANKVELSIWDGVASDGCVEYPRGTGLTDVDLDRNGVNDWSEHGKYWITNNWLAGISEMVDLLRDWIGDGEIIHLSSGRMHDFEMNTTNGRTTEHAEYILYWSSLKKKYDEFMARAPYPHTYLLDARGGSKNDYYWMRFFLAMTLYGDGYYSYSDSEAKEHYYDKYYDEFDLNFGYPTGPMVRLYPTDDPDSESGVWVRFFDEGAVIANFSSNQQTITDGRIQSLSGYDGPYYRFQGGQDPSFNNGEAFDEVTLTGRSYLNGYVGDAILLVRTPTISICDIIIDNCDAGTSPGSEPAQFTGNWSQLEDRNIPSWTVGGRGYAGIYDFTVAQPGMGESSAIFRPTIGVPGVYDVYEWHGWAGTSATDVDEATMVPYTITFTGGNASSHTINQRENYGQWNLLGTFYFDEGESGKVRVTNDADGPVIADAFKFVFKGNEEDRVLPNAPSGLQGVASEHAIDLSWSPPLAAGDGDVAAAYQVFRDHALVGTPARTSFRSTGLMENTQYLYEVYAVDKAGNRSLSYAGATISTPPDLTPPAIVQVAPLSLTSVQLVFDEVIDEGSAEDVSNYRINNNIVVLSAVLGADEKTVLLTTTDHIVGGMYTLDVEDVTDQAQARNAVPLTSLSYQGFSGLIEITISCDNAYEMFVNGQDIDSDETWSVSQTYSVPSVGGKNVIAVKGVDLGGDAGLVAEIDFEGNHYVTDETWKVSTMEQSGWQTVSFNDLAWTKATAYGLHGEAMPWAQYKNVAGISTTSGVQWIWSADRDADNVVYFRFTLSTGGDITPPSPPTGVVVTKR